MEILTYANTARKTIEPYLRLAKKKGLWKLAGAAAAGFLLSAASLGASAMPIALGLLCAAPAGAYALAAALGGCAGYWLFWRELQGLFWMAGGLLAVTVAGDRTVVRQQRLLMPAVAAMTVSACGVLFLLRFGDDTAVNIYLLRVAVSLASTGIFRRWREEPTGAAGWLVCGLGTLALAQVVPVRWLALGYLAAGFLGMRCSFPAVAMAGLGLDLARVTAVPMTGVLCLSFCLRLIPWRRKALSGIAPAAVYLTLSGVWGRFDPLPLPGLLLGGIAGALSPGVLNGAALRRRGPVGLAQVRLEKAALTLEKMEQSLLLTTQPEPDRKALLRQTADRACDTCPERKSCKARHLIPGLRETILEQPGLQTTDLPPGCKKTARLLTELRRGQEQLRRIKGDRSRLNSYRAALMDQYRFLAEYLRGLSDALAAETRQPRLRFRADIGVCARSLEGSSGDSCAEFDGVGSLKYLLLCDGMGTGEGAAGDARETVSLLRQFLEAGFPAPAALRSFNSLCALNGTGGCATVDLLEVDLRSGRGTLYKWGAGVSYLSVAGQLRKIGTATPPPGLSQQTRESVERLSLGGEEVLIMLSDGAGAEGLVRQGWSASELSAGEIASAVLEQGVQRGDDATVAVVRLVPLGVTTQ